MLHDQHCVCGGGGVNELALFAGAGGSILAGKLLGWRTVCAVEIDSYARSILLARQRDGILEPFPVWDDVTTFNGKPWLGRVDVITAGFPCQDISSAGTGAGIENGARSGLWKEAARIIGEILPSFALLENSPMLTHRGLGVVLQDLAEMGYNAEWGVFSAKECGFQHLRSRMFIVAHSTKNRRADCGEIQSKLSLENNRNRTSSTYLSCVPYKLRAPLDGDFTYRKDDGVAAAVESLAVLGNGWVPQVAVRAWNELTARISE